VKERVTSTGGLDGGGLGRRVRLRHGCRGSNAER
jgi:hypothetical protein